jgi:hypothetical protein
MLKALVITPNEKTIEYGNLIAIIRAESRRREHSTENPPIRALVYIAELKVFVGVYEIPDPSQQNIKIKK